MIEINNCTFERNTASRGSIITIFYNNTKETIYYGSSFMITKSIFISNTANDVGGIIYTNIKDINFTKSINIVQSNIINNTAVNHGGVIYSKDLSIVIISCIIKDNSANISGGAIAIMSNQCDYPSTKLTILGSTNIQGHNALIGGAIIIGCAELMIGISSTNHTTTVYITDNTALTRGGAIHAHHSCVSTHKDAEVYITDNIATYGGALSFSAGVADGNIYCSSKFEAKSNFKTNMALKHGAVVHISYAPYSIYDNANITSLLSLLPAELSYYNRSWEISSGTSLTIANAEFIQTTSMEYGSAITVEYKLFNDDQMIEDSSEGVSVSVSIENS
eukprot:547362_1